LPYLAICYGLSMSLFLDMEYLVGNGIVLAIDYGAQMATTSIYGKKNLVIDLHKVHLF
jgi:hypothetical protein